MLRVASVGAAALERGSRARRRGRGALLGGGTRSSCVWSGRRPGARGDPVRRVRPRDRARRHGDRQRRAQPRRCAPTSWWSARSRTARGPGCCTRSPAAVPAVASDLPTTRELGVARARAAARPGGAGRASILPAIGRGRPRRVAAPRTDLEACGRALLGRHEGAAGRRAVPGAVADVHRLPLHRPARARGGRARVVLGRRRGGVGGVPRAWPRRRAGRVHVHAPRERPPRRRARLLAGRAASRRVLDGGRARPGARSTRRGGCWPARSVLGLQPDLIHFEFGVDAAGSTWMGDVAGAPSWCRSAATTSTTRASTSRASSTTSGSTPTRSTASARTCGNGRCAAAALRRSRTG